MSPFVDTNQVRSLYERSQKNIAAAKAKRGKPLTLTEKILFSHFYSPDQDVSALERGKTDVALAPDRVAMQDATAQMAVLQFISVGVEKVATPSSIHCDHLIRAKEGAKNDLGTAKSVNKEVYDFLGSSAKKYGMDFWKPGSGIIHQIVLENYAFPGGMMIGTDSHTPTAGGLGMIAIGVGGADAVDVMTAQPWLLTVPKVMGVKLTGKLKGWVSPKDVILYLCGKLSVKGGTGKIIEYFGEGVESLSCTGKATITNMGAELGATTSVFPYDGRMKAYLEATGREEVAELAEEFLDNLIADEGAEYDEIVEINLDELEPALNGPHTPDAYHPLSQLKADATKLGLDKVSACLIGSCTNSSYEDISRAVEIVKDANAKNLKPKVKLMVSPGSNQVAATMESEGFTQILEEAGAVVLSNSCGPCIGQWDRSGIAPGEVNSIVTSFNRNFKKRNDGNEGTQGFVASPEMVVAMAYGGRLGFDPENDALTNENGEEVKLAVPPVVDDLPKNGFALADLDCDPPAEDGSGLEVVVDPTSERIQLLEAFLEPEFPIDFTDLPILVKAEGKCTTDHISPAGPWLKFRGHLDNISGNMYSGAVNAFSGETGTGKNVFTGETDEYNKVARQYKADGKGWVVIGDENYGEGSSREHAAMEPRFLGCKAVICKSFARIAETNLKKQGVLPLVFKNAADYEKFQENDRITILGIENLRPEGGLDVKIVHEDGSEENIFVRHTLSEEQVKWFFAGSALNRAGKILRGEIEG